MAEHEFHLRAKNGSPGNSTNNPCSRRKLAKLRQHLSRHIPLSEGRIEMLLYLREQSISIDYHRYGNLGEREI